MTDKRIWITDRLPTEADADGYGQVEYCTTPYLHKHSWDSIQWDSVTPGWPWRHTSMRTPPTPEPTPAAPEFRVGQVWRTRNGQICRVKNIYNNFDFPIVTNLYSSHCHDLHGKSILGGGTDCEDDLIELISEISATTAAPEPVNAGLAPPAAGIPEPRPPLGLRPRWSALERRKLEILAAIKRHHDREKPCPFEWLIELADVQRQLEILKQNPLSRLVPPAPEPEPEPEKAARGFLQYTRTTYVRGHAETAVGTDHTAWFRFTGRDCTNQWHQVDPLPQPGEE